MLVKIAFHTNTLKYESCDILPIKGFTGQINLGEDVFPDREWNGMLAYLKGLEIS